MNIVTILTAVAVIGSSVLALEGLNLASGGEFYLASIQHLAQNTVDSTITTTAPPPATTDSMQGIVSEPMPGTTSSGGISAPAPTTATGETITQPLKPIQQAGQQTFQPQPSCAPGTKCQQNQPMQDCPNGNCGQNQMQEPRREIRNGVRNEVRMEGDEGKDEGNQMDVVSPQEIQRILKDITQMRSQIKQIISQNKKTASASDISELNAVLAEANKAYTAIKSSSDDEMRTNMQEFYDGQYWDKIQAVRMRLEIPRELKQMAPIFKRLEKTLATKAIQNIGLDIERAKQGVAEMKRLMDQVQTAYSAGDMEAAQEAMQELRENGWHPGEIEGTIFRFRDIKNLVKRVKDEQVRNEVDGVLQEVVSAFNEGDYRQARETMDEYTDDLQRLINTFIKSKINNNNRNDSINKINSLENLIQSKLGNGGKQQQTQTTQPQQ